MVCYGDNQGHWGHRTCGVIIMSSKLLSDSQGRICSNRWCGRVWGSVGMVWGGMGRCV